MTCKDVYALASAYRAEELAPALHSTLARHLEGCVRCRSFYRGFQALLARCREAMAVEVPEGLADQLVEGFRRDLLTNR